MVATHTLDVHDDTNRRQLEAELNIEILPGTEIMADFGSHHFAKEAGSKGPVLVPHPSKSPHDPLNWTRKRKFVVIFIGNLFSFTLGFGPLALSPQFPYYMQSFNSTLDGVIQFVHLTSFFLQSEIRRAFVSLFLDSPTTFGFPSQQTSDVALY